MTAPPTTRLSEGEHVPQLRFKEAKSAFMSNYYANMHMEIGVKGLSPKMAAKLASSKTAIRFQRILLLFTPHPQQFLAHTFDIFS